MLNKLASSLIAAALFAAPVIGGLSTPAAAATTHKTKIVKVQGHHARHFRLVQCYITGAQARHVKLHAGHRFQRVACYVPTKVKVAKLHIRHGARHVVRHVTPAKLVKHVKFIRHARHVSHIKHARHVTHVKHAHVKHTTLVKQAKHVKPAKNGRTG